MSSKQVNCYRNDMVLFTEQLNSPIQRFQKESSKKHYVYLKKATNLVTLLQEEFERSGLSAVLQASQLLRFLQDYRFSTIHVSQIKFLVL